MDYKNKEQEESHDNDMNPPLHKKIRLMKQNDCIAFPVLLNGEIVWNCLNDNGVINFVDEIGICSICKKTLKI